jgi:uncharacterized NAD-dependent epimerase/dehydratase family protein
MLDPKSKVAVYMEDHIDSDYGKMGIGVVRYLKNPIVGIVDSKFAGKNINRIAEFNDVSKDITIYKNLAEVISRGAEVLILGIAPSGGRIPESWNSVINEALNSGLSIVNGLHDLLEPKWRHKIKDKNTQWIWDVRVPQFIPVIATGKAANLNNKRVLFIGTDMAVGKMTSGLELYEDLLKRKENVGFIATGQIGITITGKGIPLDAFKLDHACGAVEKIVIEESNKEILIIEGQGSILHPGSSATLPLMRGSCPTHLVLCIRADKTTLRSPENIQIPDINKFIALNESLATVLGTYPKSSVIGICANTSMLAKNKALDFIESLSIKTGIEVTDPVRFGMTEISKLLLKD